MTFVAKVVFPEPEPPAMPIRYIVALLKIGLKTTGAQDVVQDVVSAAPVARPQALSKRVAKSRSESACVRLVIDELIFGQDDFLGQVQKNILKNFFLLQWPLTVREKNYSTQNQMIAGD